MGRGPARRPLPLRGQRSGQRSLAVWAFEWAVFLLYHVDCSEVQEPRGEHTLMPPNTVLQPQTPSVRQTLRPSGARLRRRAGECSGERCVTFFGEVCVLGVRVACNVLTAHAANRQLQCAVCTWRVPTTHTSVACIRVCGGSVHTAPRLREGDWPAESPRGASAATGHLHGDTHSCDPGLPDAPAAPCRPHSLHPSVTVLASPSRVYLPPLP